MLFKVMKQKFPVILKSLSMNNFSLGSDFLVRFRQIWLIEEEVEEPLFNPSDFDDTVAPERDGDHLEINLVASPDLQALCPEGAYMPAQFDQNVYISGRSFTWANSAKPTPNTTVKYPFRFSSKQTFTN